MKFSEKPHETKPFYIEQSAEYVITRYAFRNEIPDNGHSEVMIYPTSDGKRAILEIKQKQAYPHGLRRCDNLAVLEKAVQQILSDFAEKNKLKPVKLNKSENKSLPSISIKNTAPTNSITDTPEQTKIKQNKSIEGNHENINNKKPIEKVNDKQDKPIPKTKKSKQKSARSQPPIQIIYNGKKYYVNGNEAEVDFTNGTITDTSTGEVYFFKSDKSLKKSYKRKEKEFIYNVIEGKSIFGTITSGQKNDINVIYKMGRALEAWLKRIFSIQYGFIAYEPNEDGSWHIHIVVCFTDDVPADFEKRLRKWADKYNCRPQPEQVVVESLLDKEDVMRVYGYLNPTSKKKRHREVFYPKGMKNLTVFGKRGVPQSVYVPNTVLKEFIKKNEAREIPCFNKQYVFKDCEGFFTRTIAYSYYNINLKRIRDIFSNIHKNKNLLYKDKQIKNRSNTAEQLCLFAPAISRLSSDEIYCNTEQNFVPNQTL